MTMLRGLRRHRLPGDDAIRRSMVGLTVVQALISAINLSPVMNSYYVGQVLDVNLENTAVVWLSSALLLAIAAVAFINARKDPISNTRTGWMVIGSVFTVLSIDETASLHELAGELGAHLVRVSWLPSLYTWVIVVAPFAAIGAVWMLRWFGRTLGWRTISGRMAVIAILLWMSVPLFEAVDPALGGPRVLVVLEESFEAAGEVLMLWALLLHTTRYGSRLARPTPTPG